MELKRLTEWLRTAEGLGAAVIAVIGIPASIWVAVTRALNPFLAQFGLASWWSHVGATVIIALLGLAIWRSYKRFARASRLEQPDAFTLHPTDPTSLIGRTKDLEKLINTVKQHRVVLLDGVSGCGKSALVSAGLVPLLQSSDGLLPILVRDWGEDWVRGPLSTALDGLFHALSQTDRDRLGWASSPDLAADTVALAADFEARLKAVFNTSGRRPLLIADQFDDYQALHRDIFIDDDGNWLAPKVIAETNQFWGLICTALKDGRSHLLVVTRADTAAGLACVRFLGKDQTASRTLPRVEIEYLRPLLRGITENDGRPLVVSNPEAGWHDLRERLEVDLKAEGAILMQQVRTVLLGLRQLPLLTTKCYRAAGGLRGVETLVVSRALLRGSKAIGGGEEGVEISRTMLGKLVQPGGLNQPPKAQRAPQSVLSDVAGSLDRTEVILKVLQENEVIRPAQTIGTSNAWQLDHDYLAIAVLAEARQADRWSVWPCARGRLDTTKRRAIGAKNGRPCCR